jgi:hypothetical protein
MRRPRPPRGWCAMERRRRKVRNQVRYLFADKHKISFGTLKGNLGAGFIRSGCTRHHALRWNFKFIVEYKCTHVPLPSIFLSSALYVSCLHYSHYCLMWPLYITFDYWRSDCLLRIGFLDHIPDCCPFILPSDYFLNHLMCVPTVSDYVRLPYWLLSGCARALTSVSRFICLLSLHLFLTPQQHWKTPTTSVSVPGNERGSSAAGWPISGHYVRTFNLLHYSSAYRGNKRTTRGKPKKLHFASVKG